MAKRIDLTGERFGRLTVVGLAERRTIPCGATRTYWKCACDCGGTSEVWSVGLRQGTTRSCGCLVKEATGDRFRTHGKTHTAEWRVWSSMRGRCLIPGSQTYDRYGGRGIRVCERWDSFENFLADMGPRPSPQHSIDRIDVNGNYEPSNCRWATRAEQARNRRSNRFISVRGERMSLAEAVERFGGKYYTVQWRIARGQSAEQALGLAP